MQITFETQVKIALILVSKLASYWVVIGRYVNNM